MRDIAFQKLLSSVMLDNKYDRFVKNRKAGKLDTNSLYKINHSNKLFKKREARKNKHYSVSLLVDTSGSMAGEKIEVAAKSAERLSWHLHKIGIPHNIITFNAVAAEIKPYGIQYDKTVEQKIIEDVGENSYRIFYHENGVYGISPNDSVVPKSALVKYKEKDEMLFKCLGMAAGYDNAKKLRKQLEKEYGFDVGTEYGYGWNSDAEGLRVAREVLAKQVGRRIMIVLSDGRPAPLASNLESPISAGMSQTDFNLEHEVNVTLAAGIELYSIGIRSSAVERFYPLKRTRRVQELEDLYPNIINLVKRNLKRG